MSESAPFGQRFPRALQWTLLGLNALNCVFQIAWFWRWSIHRVSVDGINYIGLARHIVDGDYRLSLHGYWSPLVTWFIAAASPFTKNLEVAGKVVTVGSFLLCLPLLYWLTLRLWHSPTAAALAVFWFSIARGIVAKAAGSVLADFLLTAFVLTYFVLLWHALRTNQRRTWLALGGCHALAFLAKAIAMPWLSIPTSLALLLRNLRAPRRLVVCSALAFLLPALTWFGWGVALKTKYGVFTTGYQLRRNLWVNWHRTQTGYPQGNPLAYADVPLDYDKYMVSWGTSLRDLQNFSLRNPALLGMILKTEAENLPSAVKEVVILLTPAGTLATGTMVLLLIQQRRMFRLEVEFASIVVVSAVGLICAYCMLVFDNRYVMPLIPPLIAVCCPLVLPEDQAGASPMLARWMRRVLLGLFVASTIFFMIYRASPFRTGNRDFVMSCFEGATYLRNNKSAGTLVSIGDGPYPEHGVGWEAATYLAYMSGWRLVGQNSALPPTHAEAEQLVNAAVASKSDAIAIWGKPTDDIYSYVLAKILETANSNATRKLLDPYKGEVGTLILTNTDRVKRQ